MPSFVKKALIEHDLMDQYNARPAYQQNDYIGWIYQAKMETTKEKRLKQMLSELRKGGVYMNMAHPASAKNKKQ
ncbi:MAG: YdeI/OmpD-associated family protein [Pseudomonadales bacterium]